MDEIRKAVYAANYEDYESKEDMVDTITCKLITKAAGYDKVAALVTRALDEREAQEVAR